MTPASSTPGYSGTPLAKKLGIRTDTALLTIDAPPAYREWLGDLPEGATVAAKGKTPITHSTDIVHLFVAERTRLEHELAALRDCLRRDAAVWVSWPKRTAKVPTDITEDVIRMIALPMGWVDIKVCAVSEVWSGLKLVVRKELRA